MCVCVGLFSLNKETENVACTLMTWKRYECGICGVNIGICGV